MWKYSLTHFYFLIFVKFINCCECNLNDTIVQKNQTGKKEPEFQDDSTTELYADNITDNPAQYETNAPRHNNSEIYDCATNNDKDSAEYSRNCANETEEIYATEENIDLDESSSTIVNEMTTEVVIERRKHKKINHSDQDMKKKCRNFKKGSPFYLKKIVDVWQVVYYRLPTKLKCFKIHIKLLKSKEQRRAAKMYGDFNETVRWNKCYLEIKSNEQNEGGIRRHFLQGLESDRGVMENIIIDEEHYHNTTYITLHRESADQWLVSKNLLVMRDCDTGDLVVFARVPMEPRRDDILDAIKIFGEHKLNGTMACDDNPDKTWFNYEESVISKLT